MLHYLALDYCMITNLIHFIIDRSIAQVDFLVAIKYDVHHAGQSL